MTPPKAPEIPEPIRSEQILELLAEHIASNDRVVAAVERVEEKIPAEAERIFQEHRRIQDNTPAPVLQLPPSEIPAAKRYLGGLINLWGTVIVALVIAGSCTILYFVFH